MNKKELLAMRKDMQLVLQDSSGALNPRKRFAKVCMNLSANYAT